MMGGGVFTVVCRDAEGNVKWEENFHNKVPSIGLQYMNNSFFTATGYSTTLYFGLINGSGPSTFAAGDTLGSHAWTENTAYTSWTNRIAASFTSASNNTPSVTTGTSASVFTMSGGASTIAGAFVCNAITGNTGVLFAEGDFAAAKSVTTGDTLSVSYQFSLTSA
jgi:hypothetical protein